MKLTINRQESYSRGKLLLRTFFGGLYIALPHGFMLGLIGIWYAIQNALLPWVILFTGNIPESWFNFRVKYMNWYVRYMAAMVNLTDEYPAFGLDGTNENISLEAERPESMSRIMNFLVFLKGIALIPHMIVIYFVAIGFAFVNFFAWWAILFTGSYPEGMFNFVTNFIRWILRINFYIGFMTDKYPPFNGKEE